MKSFISIAMAFFTISAQAQSIVIRAPGASPLKFNGFLSSRTDATSYMDYMQASVQKNSAQEEKLFRLADPIPQDSASALQEIKQIQSEAPLTLISLRYVRDLTDRLLEQKNVTSTQSELLHIYCKAAALLNEGPSLRTCPSQLVSLKQVTKKYPLVERILVESQGFSVDENIGLSPKTAYQWTLLSNAHNPINFFGTFEQLMNQRFNFENLVDGTCEGFSSAIQDFESTNRGVVFFNENCLHKVTKATDKGSWFEDNKPIIYTVGVAVLSGLAIAAMKGKRIDWSKTSIK